MTLRPRAQFVGREPELEALRAAVAAAREGSPELVYIEGEAGVGKSRLLAEAVDRFGRPGCMVAVGHGVELMGDQLPYGIIGEAVRAMVRARGSEDLPAGGDVVAHAFAAAEPTAALEGLRRGDLFGGLARLIEALAQETLMWLVLEDVHWADESSLELLAYLGRVVDSCSLLTTYTVRTGSGAPSNAFMRFTGETSRGRRATTISLDPLDRDSAEQMVAFLTDTRPTPRLMDRLLSLGNGNPLLTEELIFGGIAADGPLPASPQAAMVARVSRLSEDCARLVRMASLAYGDFSLEQLERLLPFDADRLDAALEEAIGQGLIEVSPGMQGLRFHHALFKQAIQGALSPGGRRRGHRSWAEVLERDCLEGSDPWFAMVAVAHHWVGSGRIDRAFDACMAAVGLAKSLHAPSERAPLLAEALRLWDRVPDAPQRSGWTRDRLALETIRATQFAGDWEATLALLEAELGHADSDLDRVRHTTLELFRQGALEQLGRGALADLVPRLDQFADVLLAAPDGPWLANGCVECAWRIGVSPHPERRGPLLQRAASAARASDDPEAQLNAGQTMADDLLAAGRLDEGLKVLDELMQLTTQRLPERVSDVEAQLSWFLCFRGELSAGLAVAERAMRRIPSAGMSGRLFGFVAGNLAYALIELGRWDEADGWLDQGLAAYPQGWTAFELQSEVVRLACYRGSLDLADATAEKLWQSVPRDERARLHSLGRGGTARIALATIAATRGDVTGIRELLNPVWAIPELEEQSDSAWRAILLAARAEADAAQRSTRTSTRGNGAIDADRHIATLSDVAARFHTPGALGRAWTQHLAADLSRYTHQDNPELWSDVAAGWATVGVPHDQAWALVHLAECLLRAGDKESARTSLHEAYEIATRLGAEPLAQVVTALSHRARLMLEPPGSAPDPTSVSRLRALTPRETQVLQLVAHGNSNDEIAGQLFMSPKTVSVHVSRILAKLNAKSRTEAAALAFRSGALED